MDTVTESQERVVRKDVARNRARLLAAADALVAEQGLEISLNELARRAGVGVGTVYRHFVDKEAVLNALFEHRLDVVAEVFQEASERDDPIEGLRTAVFRLGELQAGDRALFQVVAVTTSAAQRTAARKRLQPLATKLADRAKATGRMRPEFGPTDIPMLLWISMSMSEYGGAVRPDLWRRYIEVLLAGFAAEDEPHRALDVKALSPDDIEEAMAHWRESNRHSKD